ncbi:MAG: hypothetical protein ABI343_06495 [Burkholderiaceae bacterium]
MFTVINVLLVAAAFLVVLVIAATSSLPERQHGDIDMPHGEWARSGTVSEERATRVAPPAQPTRVPMAAVLRQGVSRQP